jgi:hypothetical protein
MSAAVASGFVAPGVMARIVASSVGILLCGEGREALG